MEFNRKLRRVALAASLALACWGAAAQGLAHPAADAGLDCRQLQAELAALATAPAAAHPAPDVAAASGLQLLGALAQQAGARTGGLGSMFGALRGATAQAPDAQGKAGQVLQLVQAAQAAQALPGAPGAQAVDAAQAQAQAQATAAAQVATLQALAQQRGVAGLGRHPAEAAGVVSLLGGLLSAAQAAQPVATPGHAAIQQLAGSRQEQLGGLYLAKGCK